MSDILGTKEYFLIYAELIRAARYRGTVTYQEMADLIGIQTFGAYMGKHIGDIIGVISEQEVKYGRPMLSAIVVTVEGWPSTGFYVLARELGKLHGTSDAEEEKFFRSEQQAIYATWKQTFPLPPHG